MTANEDPLDAYERRQAAKQRSKAEDQRRYEEAAKQAHKVRQAARVLRPNAGVPAWEDLAISSQRHLIADAENVARNPSISVTELGRLYRERLLAWGDSDNPDLEGEDEVVEALVLDRLRACLVKADRF